jgi:uncharacterized cofD-like protein
MKNVVVICGGSGGYAVLTGIKQYHDITPQAVVTMADNGGSTGVLRTSMGILPPGDVRRALVALSEAEEIWLKLFAYRFEKTAQDHNLGNLILAALEKLHDGNFEKAVDEAARLLRIRGSVIPVTLNDVTLHAEYDDGSIAHGETSIDLGNASRRLIRKAWLDPAGVLNPRARAAILQADLIVIGPGDVYTSLVPNLLVRGMKEAISKSPAKKVYVVNVMTKPAETNGFGVHDFVEAIRRHLGPESLTHVLYNTNIPTEKTLLKYREEGKEFVKCSHEKMPDGIECIGDDLLAAGELIRHDPGKLAHALVSLLD